jgi:hypothetical protein
MSINLAYSLTVVETIDNILFPFSTELLAQYPVNAIIANITSYAEVNGVNVVKVDINSASIQLYMYLATGFALQPMSTVTDTSNDVISLLNEYCERVVEHMIENGELNIEEEIEYDDVFDVFDVFENVESTIQEDNTSILYDGDGFDMLDNDEEFADFDEFVQQNHQQLST